MGKKSNCGLTGLSTAVLLVTATGCMNNDTSVKKGETSTAKAEVKNVVQTKAVQAKTAMLYDFESTTLPDEAVLEHVKCDTISKNEGESGKQALKVVYPADSLYKKLAFEPKTPWNISDMGDCSIALDVSNLSKESAQLFMVLKTEKQSVTGHINVGPEKSGTFYYDLSGPNQKNDLGMTGWPGRSAQEFGIEGQNAVPFQFAWGARELDLSSLKYIALYMKGNVTDRTLILDNIRIVSNPDSNAAEVKKLVDQYGQYTKSDWPDKVHSDGDMKSQTKKEIVQLTKANSIMDRSVFGGWSAGPRLKATGNFRTAKVNGKWTLVDPEGYLYFASGIANCRLVNTPTITGNDYENKEQKKGLNIASKVRRDMFEWLPEKNDSLAKHYNYAGSVHTGPLKHGETYSFYAANLERKYGTDYLNRWRDITLDRMQSWGFTCFGNWTDSRFYGNKRVAYFANAWITGKHKRVSTGNDYWGPIHDPFDPEFALSVRKVMAKVDSQVKGDPWCIGLFVDNELSWGNEWGDSNRFGLVINTLGRDVSTCPAKNAFVTLLKNRYKSIDELNSAWGITVESWDLFSKEYKHEGELKDKRREDFSMLSQSLASEYFKVVNREIKSVMPNHLYFGSRFADWGMTPEAVKGAAEHTDVMSYNLYTEGLPGHFGEWLKEIDRPSVLGEFHFGATDRGMFHGGICTASNQKDRGIKYSTYMKSVIESPFFVGAHWFQYIDSPTTGRAVDGENYNSGFVSVTDHPYSEMVKAAQNVNRDLYKIRFGSNQK